MQFKLVFHLTSLWILVGTLLALLFASAEVGWRIGQRRRHDDSARTLIGGLGAATLGVLGLLLGFALSMAISRFDARRVVIVEEANALGTLWLRAGLLDEPLRKELRGVLREYVAARVDLDATGSDLAKYRDARQRSEALHGTIWSVVERAAQPATSPAVLSSLIASANEVIDLHELRLSSLENYVPPPVIFLLYVVAAIAIGFIGWSFGAAERRSTIALAMIAALVTAVLAVIIDLNRPQRGLIRVDDASMLRLQDSIESTQH